MRIFCDIRPKSGENSAYAAANPSANAIRRNPRTVRPFARYRYPARIAPAVSTKTVSLRCVIARPLPVRIRRSSRYNSPVTAPP